MPRSEERSKKAFAWQNHILKSVQWSKTKDISYTLVELLDGFTAYNDWPKLILPESGWLGETESVSFCGDEPLVGVGVRSFKRITACAWDATIATLPSVEEIKQKAEPTHIIPLTTMDDVQKMVQIVPIQSQDLVYCKMKDLWQFHPRYAKPNKTFTVGHTTIKREQVIELLEQDSNGIRCSIAPNKTVSVPLKARGDFTIVPDKTNYNLQEVSDQFPLPQRVLFQSPPDGLCSQEVLLISDVQYDVLIACCINCLYQDGDHGKSFGASEEDIMDSSFIFFPRPINNKSPLADTLFSVWINDVNDPICQTIRSRASMFKIGQFKDVNQVIKADSDSLNAIQKCEAEDIYVYVTLGDLTGAFAGNKKASEKQSSPTKFGSLSKSPFKWNFKPPRRRSESDTVHGQLPTDKCSMSKTLPSRKQCQEGRALPPVPPGSSDEEPDYNDIEDVELPPLLPKPAPPPRPAKPGEIPSRGCKPGATFDSKQGNDSSPGTSITEQKSPYSIKFPPPNGKLVPISKLSVADLVSVFNYLNLVSIAEQLEKNKIDGDFFENSMDDEDFAGNPFNADKFQLKQINRIKQGKF